MLREGLMVSLEGKRTMTIEFGCWLTELGWWEGAPRWAHAGTGVWESSGR